eukprot:4381204-Prymnesium_polylepis.1
MVSEAFDATLGSLSYAQNARRSLPSNFQAADSLLSSFAACIHDGFELLVNSWHSFWDAMADSLKQRERRAASQKRQSLILLDAFCWAICWVTITVPAATIAVLAGTALFTGFIAVRTIAFVAALCQFLSRGADSDLGSAVQSLFSSSQAIWIELPKTVKEMLEDAATHMQNAVQCESADTPMSRRQMAVNWLTDTASTSLTRTVPRRVRYATKWWRRLIQSLGDSDLKKRGRTFFMLLGAIFLAFVQFVAAICWATTAVIAVILFDDRTGSGLAAIISFLAAI